ncbi:MAG: hypothetical protein CL878_11865 [Dehalococcoidia bacterium]|nr:hypothetical protein [Dehalococcoidia bacterium]
MSADQSTDQSTTRTTPLITQATWFLLGGVVLNLIYMGLVGLFDPVDTVALVVYVILLAVAGLLLINQTWAVWLALVLFVLDILQRGGYWYMNDALPQTELHWLVLVLSVGLTVAGISYLANHLLGRAFAPR